MSFISSVISGMLSIALVGLFIYGCYYFIRRWFKKMNNDFKRDDEDDKRKRR